MRKVFVYWDNSNIFHEAQRLADERETTPDARYRVRIAFDALYKLASADRQVEVAMVAGSVPPQLRQLWNRLEKRGLTVHLFDRGGANQSEQDMPDRVLQLKILEDAFDHNGTPGIVVLLTGDGAGYLEGSGFHRTLERIHKRGWQVEILSWEEACNNRMREWAEKEGVFVALDDFYESITYLEPSREGHLHAKSRPATPLDLTRRPLS